jgi:hypothetical protein
MCILRNGKEFEIGNNVSLASKIYISDCSRQLCRMRMIVIPLPVEEILSKPVIIKDTVC